MALAHTASAVPVHLLARQLNGGPKGDQGAGKNNSFPAAAAVGPAAGIIALLLLIIVFSLRRRLHRTPVISHGRNVSQSSSRSYSAVQRSESGIRSGMATLPQRLWRGIQSAFSVERSQSRRRQAQQTSSSGGDAHRSPNRQNARSNRQRAHRHRPRRTDSGRSVHTVPEYSLETGEGEMVLFKNVGTEDEEGDISGMTMSNDRLVSLQAMAQRQQGQSDVVGNAEGSTDDVTIHLGDPTQHHDSYRDATYPPALPEYDLHDNRHHQQMMTSRPSASSHLGTASPLDRLRTFFKRPTATGSTLLPRAARSSAPSPESLRGVHGRTISTPLTETLVHLPGNESLIPQSLSPARVSTDVGSSGRPSTASRRPSAWTDEQRRFMSSVETLGRYGVAMSPTVSRTGGGDSRESHGADSGDSNVSRPPPPAYSSAHGQDDGDENHDDEDDRSTSNNDDDQEDSDHNDYHETHEGEDDDDNDNDNEHPRRSTSNANDQTA
ncbi:unnamed protein product [Jaminaea pallidilutea]